MQMRLLENQKNLEKKEIPQSMDTATAVKKLKV